MRPIAVLAVCLPLAFVFACAASPPPGAVSVTSDDPGPAAEKVDGAKAHELVKNGARLVDVRTPDEYAEKHIDGAESVPLAELDGRDMGPKDKPMVIYCLKGGRAARAGAMLRAKGYTQVYVLGPMAAWDAK